MPRSGARHLVSRFSTEKCHDRSRLPGGVLLVDHVCSKFVSLEPSAIQPRDWKAAEVSKSVESEDQESAVSVRKYSSENHHKQYIGTYLLTLLISYLLGLQCV